MSDQPHTPSDREPPEPPRHTPPGDPTQQIEDPPPSAPQPPGQGLPGRDQPPPPGQDGPPPPPPGPGEPTAEPLRAQGSSAAPRQEAPFPPPGQAPQPPSQGEPAPPPPGQGPPPGQAPPPSGPGGPGPWTPPGQAPPPAGQGAAWPPPPGQAGGAGWSLPPGQYGEPAAQPRRSFLPIALLVVGGLVVLALFALFRQANRDDSGAVAEGGSMDVMELAVGDCLEDPLGGQTEGEVAEVQVVVCSEPHDSEVYALFDTPEGPDAEYPGDDAVNAVAEDGCLERFEGYVGQTYENSALFITTISPRSQTWSMGDREVVCLAYDPEEQLTGSVQGSGQ